MRRLLLITTVTLLGIPALISRAQPHSPASDLLIEVELNPARLQQAKRLAADQGLPISVQLPSGTLMYAMGIEQNKPLYVVITDPLHPFEGCFTALYDEIEQRFDLSSAKKIFRRPSSAFQPSRRNTSSLNTRLLLVPDWTDDRVWAFDAVTGNLVDTAFTHGNNTALESPKQALEHPVHRFITVSDQIRDLVQKFDPANGTWLSWFAPATGVNNAILDNIRGHAYRPNNNLLVTVASGSNSNAIAQFDTGGNSLGNFIAPGTGGLNSPFDIMIRSNDILISQSSSPTGVKQYALDGTYLAQWATISSFPQQMFRLQDGRIAVANFSGTGSTGIRLYDANGNFLRLLSGVTGNRGVYQLPNGNFLTTNASGLHEIDSTTGNLIRTIQAGTNFQYINLYDPASVAVEEPPPAAPVSFALEQNFPNPFNPSTTISFTLPEAAHVTLKVFDLLGREVATLVNEARNAGKHSVTFSTDAHHHPAGLSSGLYFYRLQAGSWSSTKKMALVQ
jgi:hypothetical protein